MAISNYENGFPNGVTIRGIPLIDIQNSAGQVFWVDSNYYLAGDANSGTFSSPLKTLQAAVDKCRPNQGDKIFLAAGHTEELDGTNNVFIDKTGIQIIGLGNKENKPTFTLTTSTTAAFDIDSQGENLYLANIRLVGHIFDVSYLMAIWAKNVYIENVTFEGSGDSYSPVDLLRIPGAGAENNNFADNATIINCEFYPKAPNNAVRSAIYIGAANTNLKILGCTIIGSFDEGAILNPDISPAEVNNIQIDGCTILNEFLSGGSIRTIHLKSDKFGYISPNNIILNTKTMDPVWEVNGRSGRNITGDSLFINKEILAVSIATTGYYLCGDVAGNFSVEGISLETDATGLATATAINIEKTNESSAHGNPIFFSVPIASLGANQTVDMDNAAATISNKGSIINDGRFIIKAIGADATGGSVRVTIRLKAVIDASGLGELI